MDAESIRIACEPFVQEMRNRFLGIRFDASLDECRSHCHIGHVSINTGCSMEDIELECAKLRRYQQIALQHTPQAYKCICHVVPNSLSENVPWVHMFITLEFVSSQAAHAFRDAVEQVSDPMPY